MNAGLTLAEAGEQSNDSGDCHTTEPIQRLFSSSPNTVHSKLVENGLLDGFVDQIGQDQKFDDPKQIQTVELSLR